MESIGNYLIQMACWLTGFWLIYFLFLRKETFYETNRWFLLTGLFFSLVMPFIPVSYTATRVPLNTDILLKATAIATGSKPEGFNLFSTIWLWLYLSGTLFFAIRFSNQWLKVRRLKKEGIRLNVDSTEVFLIEKETAPFSFFSKIFISKSLGNDVEIKTIVSHEKVHIHERHWADLLIFEIVRILQWFNPLLLFYRKAMMQNHEYLADRGATASGMNIRTYQSILANQLLGVPVVRYASSFTMFNPTKRITMMNKNKTKPMKQFKLLWAVPIMALILYAFAEPKYTDADNPNLLSQQNEKGISANGIITNNNGKALNGAHIIVANSTTGTISAKNGEFTLEGLKPEDELIISYVGYKTVKIKAGENLKVKMERNVIKVPVAENDAPPPPPPPPPPPANVNKVVYKIGEFYVPPTPPTPPVNVNKVAVAENGENDAPPPANVNKVAVDQTGENAPPPPPPPPPPPANENKVVYKIGQFYVPPTPPTPPVNVNKVAVAETGENDAPPPPPPPPPPPSYINIRGEGPPLIVVDGVIKDIDLNEIEPETIQTFSVIKPNSETKKYGEKGKNGVIEITTKKEKSGKIERIKTPDKKEVIIYTNHKEKDDIQNVAAEEMPQFIGGSEALGAFLNKSTTNAKEKGVVKVSFTVDADGDIDVISVDQNVSNELRKQAMKVMKSMPKWKPGMQNGKKVKVDMEMNIIF